MVKHNADMRGTEVNALNMEVDTLRWQLAQVITFETEFVLNWCTNVFFSFILLNVFLL